MKKGFTLVEMLISITLFTIVTTIAFTALYSIMDANEKAKTIKLVVNNLNIAMESMSRELRVGYDYCKDNTSSGNDCNNSLGGNEIYFTTKDGCEGVYKYDNSGETIKKQVSEKVGGSCQELSVVPLLPIVGDDILITDAEFYILGVGDLDNAQPRIIIILHGETARTGIDTNFDIQTTVSQRKTEQ